MRESILGKIVKHPDRQDIVSRLSIGVDPSEVSDWLAEKYASIDKSLVLTKKNLVEFKEEYLNYYTQIQRDTAALTAIETTTITQQASELVQSNSAYRQKLENYLDKEIDIKTMVKNLILAVEFRAAQLFDNIQKNPTGTKGDYVLVNYLNALFTMLEKYDSIINGSPDKVTQQNAINMQVLERYIGVVQTAIHRVVGQLDYETSLKFIAFMNEEMTKVKMEHVEIVPQETRLIDAQNLSSEVTNQLDIP